MHVLLFRDMTDHFESLIYNFEKVEVVFVQFECVLFHLSQIKQVHHQVSHNTRCEAEHFYSVDEFCERFQVKIIALVQLVISQQRSILTSP